jgi:hypothetical protein
MLNVRDEAASGPAGDNATDLWATEPRLVLEDPEAVAREREDAPLGWVRGDCRRRGGVNVQPDPALAERRYLVGRLTSPGEGPSRRPEPELRDDGSATRGMKFGPSALTVSGLCELLRLTCRAWP